MKLDPDLPKGVQMAELPARVRWKADNYNHLLEQPTLFYALAFTLALWNKIEIGFVLFLLSSLVLVALVVRAALLVWS
jgi:hypothetical protein